MAAPRDRAPVAWARVAPAVLAQGVLLAATSNRYGFHRDELYFRALPAAWGYFDQPPLTPALARLAAAVSGEPWVMRVPAMAAALASVLVVVLITRELGGGRAAQTACAWGYAFALTPLLLGHVLLTASLDLLVWPLICLFVMRALLGSPRWWLAAGAVVGVATWNRLLVASLVVALVVALLVAGPRRALLDRWLLGGAGIAVVLALPTLLYQATHSWPQLTMARALGEAHPESRVLVWPFLLLLLGPPLVPIWVAGLVALWRRPQWRPVRLLVVALGVLLVELTVSGGQIYYPFGLLAVVFAAGCVPTVEFLARTGSAAWRRVVAGGVVLNGVVSTVIALPVLPVAVLAASPVPSINQLAADQVGWPTYVGEVAQQWQALAPEERAHAVVITSNYGEAGAIARYGAPLGLPPAYSGQNQLYYDARPPDAATTVVLVGGQLNKVASQFGRCTVVATLDNRVGVAGEEQRRPIAVCRDPLHAWSALWAAFRHTD